MLKLGAAYTLLRKLYEKQAGIGTPLLVGAGVAAGAHTLHKGIQKSREYRAGFQPIGSNQ